MLLCPLETELPGGALLVHISPASHRQVRVNIPHSGLARDWAQLYHSMKEAHVMG